jgi:hypothetical protein
MSELPNPYENELLSPDFRLNVNVKTEDILTIKSVAPSRGTIQHLIAGYVKSLADELRNKQLASYSPDNFTSFAEIVRRRNQWTDVGSTASGSAQHVGQTNDGPAKKGVRSNAKNSKSVRSGTKS